MKLKIILLKKKYIYYVILIIIAFALLLFFISKKSINTFNNLSKNKPMKIDITGDGKNDLLYIKDSKNKYHIEIKTENKTLYLEPNKKSNTIGCPYDCWPIKIKFMDINRDKNPEIFTQASYKKMPIQHIFLWNNENFEDIFFSSNNVLGIIDSTNNKTPKILSGNIKNNKLNFIDYIFVNGRLENFNYNHDDNFMGKNTILSLLKYIENFSQDKENIPIDIFSNNLIGKNISTLNSLLKENNSYSFQDAFFKDTKYNKNGTPSEIKWELNLKVNSNNTNEKIKNYNLKIILKPSKDYTKSKDKSFKIFSIKLN